MTFVRSLLYNAYFWLVTAAFTLPSVAVRLFARRHALRFGKVWARAVLAGLGPLAGVKVAISGAERIPRDGPALVASQHQSAFDTLIWLLLLPRPAYVVKRELLRIPFYGPMLRPAGQIVVDRKGGASALSGLVREAGRAIDARRQVIIFPEGTRVAPGKHGIVQPGIAALARQLHLPVIPVATDSGRLWGRRAFQKRAGTINIIVGSPLSPDLPPREILRALASFYADPVSVTNEPVDNLVDEASQRFESGRNEPLHSAE